MKPIVEKLLGGLIISCQAYEDTPLYGADNMARFARCAAMGGADGIRACWPQDIRAIRAAVDLPIIGINKYMGAGDQATTVFITPTFESAAEVIEAGADILALDCTIRPSRGKEALYELLSRIHRAYPEVPVMADLATLEEARFAEETGFVDIISSTLSGYTAQSAGHCTDGPDTNTIRSFKAAVKLPVNAEGRIWELADLRAVIDAGADIVTIGTAVTRPHLITERFVKCSRAARG